jgi:hypothetical protein
MNTRLFLANLSMVVLLLVVSGYELVFYFTATRHGELLNLGDCVSYAAWVFIWVLTVGVGIEVIKDAYRAEEEAWIASQMPPLFLEGGV